MKALFNDPIGKREELLKYFKDEKNQGENPVTTFKPIMTTKEAIEESKRHFIEAGIQIPIPTPEQRRYMDECFKRVGL